MMVFEAKPTKKRLEEALNATSRALGHTPKMQVTLQGSHSPNPLSAQDSLYLAPPKDEDYTCTRAEIDRIALAKRYHHAASYSRHIPSTESGQTIYEALELARIDALGAREYLGYKHNIMMLREDACKKAGYAMLSERADPPLADMLAALLLKEAAHVTFPDALTHLMQSWEVFLQQHCASSITQLLQSAAMPERFAPLAKQFITQLEDVLLGKAGQGATPDAQVEAATVTAEALEGQSDADSGDDDAGEAESQQSADDAASSGFDKVQSAIGQLDDTVTGALDSEAPHGTPTSRLSDLPAFQPKIYPYTIFSTAHDEVIPAEQLVSAEELTQLRAELDSRLEQVSGTFTALSAKLQRYLLAKQQRHWTFDLEEGQLDSARLARLVINPYQTNIFKMEHENEFRDTVVTLLLDNSGSMRGRPITITALSSDILAKVLERVGIKTEILGFTTKEWKGGKHYKAWMQAGKPPHPGRLNDVRHIIYKSADMPFVRARRNLGLMLKDGILKENIDGEALQWAYARIKNRAESRKILMVISDGAPVDDATLSANNPGYLDKHLRHVIAQVQQDSAVELVAIGIGHDVTRYYERSICLRDISKLGETMTNELVKLFEQ
jgi:cobaltochelatase CobT